MQAIKWVQDENLITVELEPNQFAVVGYQRDGDVLRITSTRIPDELQGKGFGKVMMGLKLNKQASKLFQCAVMSCTT